MFRVIIINNINIHTCRVSINNENENTDERKIDNVQDALYNVDEKYENAREILVVIPDEYDKPINEPQKLDILQFLVSLMLLLLIH